MSEKVSIAIIGAGPAGLTAAYLLSKGGAEVTVLESDPVYVGGISRTVENDGYRFDIGGHRFFSKSQEVEDFWTEILPNDMLVRPRSSRIYYRGKFFSYPLAAMESLTKLGVIESILCVISYIKARLFPVAAPVNFEDWVSNQFGRRLFNTFFKTYTEKVWGISCKEISADWAAQRIKGLSLTSAIVNALFPKRNANKGKVIKTLIDSFRYPRKGPGMMWEVCAQKVQSMGGQVEMDRRVVKCSLDAGAWTVIAIDSRGQKHVYKADHIISSAPVRELTRFLEPALPAAVEEASSSLKYRDFVTVALIYKHNDSFQDNWIYIHEPSVKVGRVQNFRSWSEEMVPDPTCACYGLEYFCFEGDAIWNSSDEELIALGRAEMEKIGLGKDSDFIKGCVVRQPKAYPVYDDSYASHMRTIREHLEAHFPTLYLVGRNGMHKYNNQDHSMMTAMLCAKNILAGNKIYDLWAVNQDAEYHEISTEKEAHASTATHA